MIISMTINGEQRTVTADGWESLLVLLRTRLDLPGTKNACEQGECGSCSVIMDDKLVCACLVMGADCEGTNIVTVEGLGTPEDPDPIQSELVATGAVQCGFCTPGLVVTISHLLERNPHPDTDEVREQLSGNICRCTGYGSILRSVERLGVIGGLEDYAELDQV